MDILIRKNILEKDGVYIAKKLITGETARKECEEKGCTVFGLVGNERRLGFLEYYGSDYSEFIFIPVGDLNNYEVITHE